MSSSQTSLVADLSGLLQMFFPRFDRFQSLHIANGVADFAALSRLRVTGEGEVQRAAPQTVERQVHSSYISALKKTIPEHFIVSLEGGYASQCGTCLTGNGKLVPELSTRQQQVKEHPFFSYAWKRHLRRVHFVEGPVMVLHDEESKDYFHWLFNVIARLSLLYESGKTASRIYIDTSQDFQKEALDLLGIKKEHILSVQDYPLLSASQLLIPTHIRAETHLPSWACRFLRDRLFPSTEEPSKKYPSRIYLSRAGKEYRQVHQENQVIALLKKHDFSMFQVDRMPFLEQIRLFQHAQVIVSPHSSALSNLVFCSPQTQVLELFSPEYIDVRYWVLANQLRLNYHYMLGDKHITEGDPVHGEISFPLKKLHKALPLLGLRTQRQRSIRVVGPKGKRKP